MSKVTFTWPSISASLDGSGLATETTLSAINTKTPSLGQALAAASVPVVLTAAQVSTLTPLSTVAATQSGTWNVANVSGTVSLPTGAATESTLSTLNGKITAVNTGAVVVSSSALPSGAATESTLSTLNGKVTAVNTGAVVVASSALPSGAATESTLSTLNGKVTAVNTGAVVVASSALPSGAATESTLSSIDTKTPALGQALAAASTPVVLTAAQLSTLTPLSTVAATQSGTWTVQPGNTANTTPWLVKLSGKTAVDKVRNDYTSTSVTTGAYVQLIASLAAAATEVEIFDSSGQTLFLATGAAASEVNQVYILPGGNGRIPLTIAASTRISVKAVSATASVGELTINFYG